MQCNILFGLPLSPNYDLKVIDFFLSLSGFHIVCGGTTAQVIAKKMGKPLNVSLLYYDKDVPPMGYIEGIDLVTEGVITMAKVLEYVKDYWKENELESNKESSKSSARNEEVPFEPEAVMFSSKNSARNEEEVPKSGASKIVDFIIYKAQTINFLVGSSNEKRCEIVDELCSYLKRLGKEVSVTKLKY